MKCTHDVKFRPPFVWDFVCIFVLCNPYQPIQGKHAERYESEFERSVSYI